MSSILNILKHPRVATVGLLGVGISLGILSWRSTPAVGTDVAIVGGPYIVGGKEVSQVIASWEGSGPPDDHLTVEPFTRDDGSVVTRVRFAQPGLAKLTIDNNPTGSHRVRVETRGFVWAVAALFLLIAIWIPYALGAINNGAWYALLSEAGGGYSLSRVQILIWFLPTAVLYAAVSFTLRQFIDVTTQVALLLGMSAATAGLGTAANPTKVEALAKTSPEVDPQLRDMVSDWNNHGDVSRYQYLLLSIIGAVTMVVSFWRQMEFPDIPSQFLFLVAGSQGTYLAVKAIKTAGMNTAATSSAPTRGAAMPSRATVAMAPLTSISAPPGTTSEDGSYLPAES